MQSNGECKREENFMKKKGLKMFEFTQIVLRVSALALSIAATSIVFTSNQSALIFGIPMEAKYGFSSAIKFFGYVTTIASACSLLCLGLTFYLRRTESSNANYHNWFFFMHDLVIMSLLLAGCAAATAIGYVGQYGNNNAGWMPICDHFASFCHRLTTSIVLGYLSFIIFFILTIISAIKTTTTTATIAQFISYQI